MSIYDTITDEIKQDYYAQNYDNDGQRFIAWYLRNIHLRDMNEAKFDVTDGADDKQIDAIHVDVENSKIYIIQGKFISAPTIDAEPVREVLAAWTQLKDLVRLQENCNDRLKRKLSEVATALDEDYEVVFELVTTATLTDVAMQDVSAFAEEITRPDDFVSSIQVVDRDELQRRYDLALDEENPSITHSFQLEAGKHLPVTIAGTKALIAAIQLKDCLTLPGIKDGTLFQKNVRQALGLSNPVNKGIRATIYGDRHRDFFFFHNGITAICNRMELSDSGLLTLRGLSVVNGCQSLNTILSCSERAKSIPDTYVMFRFYEIPQRERADRISIYTNSQSAVKPRDLRANDKSVLSLKRRFEQKYPRGYLVTKRGEEPPPDRDKMQVLDLSELGKYLMSWQSQRPNMAYSETRIFDKYFEQLFRQHEYSAEDAQALNQWMHHIQKGWVVANPFGLNESLLAMKSYAPYHHLYAISMCFSISSNLQEMAPSPAATYERAKAQNKLDQIVEIAASCLNTALEAAANEQQPANRVFSPQNWVKAKACLSAINAAIRQYFSMLPTLPIPGMKEHAQELREVLTLTRDQFDYRWAAD